MFNNNKILVVIPARGGSKGIPRKNIRLLADKPLISYSIDVAKASKYVDDVVVSTEDTEIVHIAEKFGASIIRRSPDLAGDRIPIDPVIFDATVQKEKQAFDEYDIVVTLQATSPLLKTETLDKAIEKFKSFDVDTVISVVEDKQLRWGYNDDENRYFPLYSERLNVQYLPKEFKETGSIFATRRGFLTPNSRLGNNVELIELSSKEGLNIQTQDEWWIAEHYLNKKKIAIVVSTPDYADSNHIYRSLSLASKLFIDEFLFLVDENYKLGIDVIEKFEHPCKLYDGEDELFSLLSQYGPQIVVNDISDTTKEYVSRLKEMGYFVINFEDIGMGSEDADVVFDALYEHDGGFGNIFSGHKYFILKDEFYFLPSKIVGPDVNGLLITFEGRDENGLTEKVLDSVLATGFEGRIDVILDDRFANKSEIFEKYDVYNNVQIYSNVTNVGDFMLKADIVITSAGRTMYEVCCIGTPCICICQNGREQTHAFGSHNNGFINMGLADTLSSDDISNQFKVVWQDFELRQNMSNLMKKIDLKHGYNNIRSVVEERYWVREFQHK